MIIKRKYYSEKEQTEDPKKKRKLANAAGASLIGMGGALTCGSKFVEKVQKDFKGLSAKQIKEKFPKMTDEQIKKYIRTSAKPETLKKAGRLGYATMAAGAATLGASIYDKNKKRKTKEKNFAERDYKGLTNEGKFALKIKRNEIARQLRELRFQTKEHFNNIEGKKNLKFNHRFKTSDGSAFINASAKIKDPSNPGKALKAHVDDIYYRSQAIADSAAKAAKDSLDDSLYKNPKYIDRDTNHQFRSSHKAKFSDGSTKDRASFVDLNAKKRLGEDTKKARAAVREELENQIETRQQRLDRLRKKLVQKKLNKNLKRTGKIVGGLAATGLVAYGGKKLYDKKRKAAKDDNTEK